MQSLKKCCLLLSLVLLSGCGKSLQQARDLAAPNMYQEATYENAAQSGPSVIVVGGTLTSKTYEFLSQIKADNLREYGELELGKANFKVIEKNSLANIYQEIAIAANLTADLFWYSLGYSGKVTWLLPYARWFGIRPQHISQLQDNMYLHAHRVLPLTKFGAGLAIPALIATGLARAPWQRWLPTLAVAEALRSTFLVMVGYTAANALNQASQGIQVVMIAVTLSFIIAIIVWLLPEPVRTAQTDITGFTDFTWVASSPIKRKSAPAASTIEALCITTSWGTSL